MLRRSTHGDGTTRRAPVRAAAVALAMLSAGVAVGQPAGAAAGCSVSYAVTSQWPGGFVASVAVTNVGDTLTGWRLTWTFPGSQVVTSGWNAGYSQSGAQITAINAAYNATLPTGGTASLGFQGTYAASNPSPTSFALNGVTCTGGTVPTTSTTSSSSSTTTTTTSRSTSTTTRTSTTTTRTTATTRTSGSTSTTSTSAPSRRIRGGDVSSLKKNEDKGAVYYDQYGQRADALTVLRSHGMNWARLKVWVNPADGYNTKARVLEMARRIKGQGMGLLVDFHYSDSWADPGKQVKPAAWSGYSFSQLRQAVYDHTYDVLSALRAQGTTADMVQVGNEINPGMLLPDGSINTWPNLAQLINSGARAVKDVSPSTRVVLHLAEGGDNARTRWWFDQAVANGVNFDVIGLSHYVYWHGSVSALRTNVNDISARYGKDVVVVETAYGFTLNGKDSQGDVFNASLQQAWGYPATPEGQAAAFRDVISVMNQVPNGRGLGVFYWEPAWTAVTGAGWDPTDPSSGNGWENQALFDYTSRPLPAMSVFGSS